MGLVYHGLPLLCTLLPSGGEHHIHILLLHQTKLTSGGKIRTRETISILLVVPIDIL